MIDFAQLDLPKVVIVDGQKYIALHRVKQDGRCSWFLAVGGAVDIEQLPLPAAVLLIAVEGA